MISSNKFLSVAGLATLFLSGTLASFLDQPSVVTYWGQNSAGGQKSLATYCDDDSTDVIVLSFTLNFHDGKLPLLNLADACSDKFSGLKLLSCPSIGNDIKTCQSKGKTVLMSLGGAEGKYGFHSDDDAKAFADTLWKIYGGGTSDTRPFGDVKLDGFDLDIEGGGSSGYAAMVTQLRSHFSSDSSKPYYITAAPQCPYPDSLLSDALNAVKFDAVFVQFYNNFCATATSSFNYDTWDKWATKTSLNSKVKIMIGIPGSKDAAGSGYIDFEKLGPIVKDTYSKYKSFGGIMVWDASCSYANTDVSPNYQKAVAGLVRGLGDSNSNYYIREDGALPYQTPNNDPIICAKPGDSGCIALGMMMCHGNSYYTYIGGHNWTLRDCPVGTSCFGGTDGYSIYCTTQAPGSTATVYAKQKNLPKTILTNALFKLVAAAKKLGGPIAKAYKNNKVVAQFSVAKATHGSFDAVINARRLDKKGFGKTVQVQFKVADNVKVTKVQGGKVTQKGNHVKIGVRNNEMMATVIRFSGKITGGGVFTAPNVNTVKFS